MRLATLFALSISCCFLSTQIAAADNTTWGSTRSCFSLCAEKSLQPVLGGVVLQSSDNYLVCTAQVGTEIMPGWQITGAFGNGCDTSADGKGRSYPVQSCLCSDRHIEPTK
jgi:hypothetical protein